MGPHGVITLTQDQDQPVRAELLPSCRRPQKPSPTSRWFVVLSLLAWLLVTAETSRAQYLRSSELEAAFLLNFLRFTSWPNERFDSPNDPVVVTVIGADAIALDLSLLSSSERLGTEGRSVIVQARNGINPSARGRGRSNRPATSEDLRRSHMIFVGQAEDRNSAWILEQIADNSVLTVGNDTGFALEGGMLALVVRGGRMTFDANTAEIDRSGLIMSSKVLRLARLVGTESE